MTLASLLNRKRIDEAQQSRAVPNRVITPPSMTPLALTSAEETITMATTAVAIPTPVSPNPNGFKNFMGHIGHAFKDVFAFLGSKQGQQTIAAVEGATNLVATAVNPAAGAALVGIESLINAALPQAVQIETLAVAAGQATGTGTQKAAAVTAALTPQIASFLKTIGISSPTADQVQSIGSALSTAVVGVLNAIPAPAAPAQ